MLTSGGRGDYEVSEETREKFKRPMDKEIRHKISITMSILKQNMSEEERKELSNYMKNNNPMQKKEYRDKISEKLSNVPKSSEAKKNMSKSHTNLKDSKETKKRKSESQKRRRLLEKQKRLNNDK
jgi:hypothetical protein